MVTKSVLIADDEPALLQLLTLRCGQELGLKVSAATDGLQALMLAASEMPDLVILDVNMPGTDGITVCEQLAADPKLSGLQVLILTSRSDEEVIRRCEAVGAHYCHKGLEVWNDLDVAIRRLLDLETDCAPAEVANAAAPQPADAAAAPAASPRPHLRPSPPTVLVVDDDAEITKAIWAHLHGLGIEVFRAPHARVGLMIAEAENPNVIITSYDPPQSASKQMLMGLKRNSKTRNIPIILLTAGAVDEQYMHDLKREMLGWSGEVAMISKPLNFDALLTELTQYIELPKTS